KKTITGLPIICLYELMPKHIPQVMRILIDHQGCFNFHDALFIFFLKQVPKVNFVTFDKDFQKVPAIRVYPG
ncbi:MAG: hypothetical protein HY609_03045, partial [Deltaproteobacteria bacterium]|nr:hypothetical protein [Deltaproteobacteria bacterium]